MACMMPGGAVIWYVVNGPRNHHFTLTVYSREPRVCVWDYMNKYKTEAEANNLGS